MDSHALNAEGSIAASSYGTIRPAHHTLHTCTLTCLWVVLMAAAWTHVFKIQKAAATPSSIWSWSSPGSLGLTAIATNVVALVLLALAAGRSEWWRNILTAGNHLCGFAIHDSLWLASCARGGIRPGCHTGMLLLHALSMGACFLIPLPFSLVAPMMLGRTLCRVLALVWAAWPGQPLWWNISVDVAMLVLTLGGLHVKHLEVQRQRHLPAAAQQHNQQQPPSATAASAASSGWTWHMMCFPAVIPADVQAIDQPAESSPAHGSSPDVSMSTQEQPSLASDLAVQHAGTRPLPSWCQYRSQARTTWQLLGVKLQHPRDKEASPADIAKVQQQVVAELQSLLAANAAATDAPLPALRNCLAVTGCLHMMVPMICQRQHGSRQQDQHGGSGTMLPQVLLEQAMVTLADVLPEGYTVMAVQQSAGLPSGWALQPAAIAADEIISSGGVSGSSGSRPTNPDKAGATSKQQQQPHPVNVTMQLRYKTAAVQQLQEQGYTHLRLLVGTHMTESEQQQILSDMHCSLVELPANGWKVELVAPLLQGTPGVLHAVLLASSKQQPQPSSSDGSSSSDGNGAVAPKPAEVLLGYSPVMLLPAEVVAEIHQLLTGLGGADMIASSYIDAYALLQPVLCDTAGMLVSGSLPYDAAISTAEALMAFAERNNLPALAQFVASQATHATTAAAVAAVNTVRPSCVLGALFGWRHACLEAGYRAWVRNLAVMPGLMVMGVFDVISYTVMASRFIKNAATMFEGPMRVTIVWSIGFHSLLPWLYGMWLCSVVFSARRWALYEGTIAPIAVSVDLVRAAASYALRFVGAGDSGITAFNSGSARLLPRHFVFLSIPYVLRLWTHSLHPPYLLLHAAALLCSLGLRRYWFFLTPGVCAPSVLDLPLASLLEVAIPIGVALAGAVYSRAHQRWVYLNSLESLARQADAARKKD